MKERLQKILARAGLGSRRSVEALIVAGRVSINGEVVTQLGVQCDPDVDRIEVDGKRIELPEERIYLAMNKPRGVVTTAHDPQRRRTVVELLPSGLAGRVFPVGRLDRDTEGLLLFTNDGELAHRLSHPRYVIDKEYLARVEGTPDERALERLRRGVDIEGVMTSPAQVERAAGPPGARACEGHSWLRLVIHEGRKRQIRRMCEAVGHPVRDLIRVRVGGVQLSRLQPGATRHLEPAEVAALRRAVGLDGDQLGRPRMRRL